MQSHTRIWAVMLLAALVPAGTSVAREKATVTVTYVLGPPRPLPENLKAVAVIDAGVQTQGAQQDDRERKWSAMAADMIEAMIQNSSAQYGGQLAVAKRSQTRRILEEQDLRLSGLVEGDNATRAGKLLAVQGLITSRLTINIDVQKANKSTIDWTGFLGGALEEIGGGRDRDRHDRDRDRREYRVRSDQRVIVRRPPPAVVRVDPRGRDARGLPVRRVYLYPQGYQPTQGGPHETAGGAFGGFAFKTKEVEAISRSLTVQCSFSLIDATTGRAIAQYSPPPLHKTDTASPNFLFGSMMKQGDLDPVDQFIGELVERATRDFVSTLVPVQYEQTCELSLKGKHGELAIRAIRADDYDTARKELEAAAADGKDKDGSVSYAMGVVCELVGDFARARDMYRQAASAEDVDKDQLPSYLAAKERMANHMHRIMVMSPDQNGPAPAPAPRPAAGQPPGPPPQEGAGNEPGEPPPPPPPPRPRPQSGRSQQPPSRQAQTQPAGPSSVDDELRILKDLENKDKK